MTQETTDTKAAWKRRALRAETELELLRRFRQTDFEHHARLAREHAEMTVALREARDILGSVTPGQGVPA